MIKILKLYKVIENLCSFYSKQTICWIKNFGRELQGASLHASPTTHCALISNHNKSEVNSVQDFKGYFKINSLTHNALLGSW